MILTFSQQQFVDNILAGTKMFTLRKSDRYHAGQQLQLWHNNPRNVSLNPYQFATAICTQIDKIEMNLDPIEIFITPLESLETLEKDRYQIHDLTYFAMLDGFNGIDQMKAFFIKNGLPEYRIWFDSVKAVKRH